MTIFRKIFNVLTAGERREVIFLFVLGVCGGLTELLVVFSVAFLLSMLVAGAGGTDNLVALSDFLNIGRDQAPLLFALTTAIIVAVGTSLNFYVMSRTTTTSQRIGANFYNRLFDYYTRLPWLGFLARGNSKIISNLNPELLRVSNGFLLQVLMANARLTHLFVVMVALLIYSPLIFIISISFLLPVYLLLYTKSRPEIENVSEEISSKNKQRMRLLQSALDVAREIRINDMHSEISYRMHKESNTYGELTARGIILAQRSRYVVEFLLYFIIASVAAIFFAADLNASNYLTDLAVYAVAIQRVMPSLQQGFASIVTAKTNKSAFDYLYEDLACATEIDLAGDFNAKTNRSALIKIEHLSYSYPGSSESVLSSVSIDFEKNGMYGITGPSGSGKTTLIDIVSGLITVEDQSSITNEIQADVSLGYVPQSPRLISGTLRENILLGLKGPIDDHAITTIIEGLGLKKLMDSRDEGLDAFVGGDSGITLSGGQIQRIGIARALLRSPKILILDEATSALDFRTEQKVLAFIKDRFNENVVIFISHKLTTLSEMENVIVLEGGKIKYTGPIADAFHESEYMARLSAEADS